MCTFSCKWSIDQISILIIIKHLDYYIESFKKAVAEYFLKNNGINKGTEEIFEIGYCDKPLYDNRSLGCLFQYIRENPHRLAIRHQYPSFFQRVRRLHIGSQTYEAYGNLFLLRNPDKVSIKISRNTSPAEKLKKQEAWLSEAITGTIMVSPFISEDEKSIRVNTEGIGGKVILLTHEAFPEIYKPAARDFNLCSEGRLLII